MGETGRRPATAGKRTTLVSNSLESNVPDATSVSYAYDAFGRRVMRDETYWHNNGRLRSDVVHYLYDGLEVLKEYGGTPGEGRPPLAEYWRANGRIVAKRLYGNPTRPGPGNDDFLFTRGGLLYYHYDALGTVQALTDRQGDVIAQYYYDVFGQPWAGPLGAYNAYGLTGKEYDSKTGLYYFGARWYDPQVGRWMSQDPARDGLNWYAYVGNSPTSYVDFWGLWRIKEREGQRIAVAESGDTLSGLALQEFGDASLFEELAAHNNLADPNMISVGQQIHLPSALAMSGPGPLGWDPTKGPPGTVWKGKDPPGGRRGNWVNEEEGKWYHPDLDHGPPYGPHWDEGIVGEKGTKRRLNPNTGEPLDEGAWALPPPGYSPGRKDIQTGVAITAGAVATLVIAKKVVGAILVGFPEPVTTAIGAGLLMTP